MIYTAEHSLEKVKKDKNLIFLAGSIDTDVNENWRMKASASIGDNFNFFDPTNLNYDSLTENDWDEHIRWELVAMEMSDLILINFLPNAKSPISLVELGLNITKNKIVVVCPKGFYKNSYIQTLCKFYTIPIFDDLKSATNHINTNYNF